MLQPYQGRVLDPACGSCGLFVQSGRFIEAHGGNPDKISIYGQERNQATWRIGLMNLAIHGLSGEVRYTEAGSLLDDAFPSLKADFVMANPPFNQKEWATPGDPRRRALGSRHPAGEQRQLRVDPALPAPPRPGRPRRLRHGQRLADDHDRRRGRHPRRTRPRRRRRLHRRAARRSSSTPRASPSACGSLTATRPQAANATAAGRRSSSTPARWDARSAARRSSSTDEEIERIAVDLPRLARPARGRRLRRRPRLLQERDARMTSKQPA